MSKEKRKKEAQAAPSSVFFKIMGEIFGAGSDIGDHLQRSQLELLKAIRA